MTESRSKQDCASSKVHRESTTGAMLIYFRTRANTEAIQRHLARYKIEARAYHAEMAQSKRDEALEYFKEDPNPTVCATIAFGMVRPCPRSMRTLP